MIIHVMDDYEQMSIKAAGIVADQVTAKSDTVLGLATGSTPEGMYRLLVEKHRRGMDFSRVVAFNLDEYIGLPPEHPQSYHYYMYHKFFKHINIPPQNINIPRGLADNFDRVCQEYDRRINEAGGIDLLVLGVGRNGHIGFNEPNSRLNIGTHVIGLTENTIKVNGRFFRSLEEVPRRAITMGMGSILKARKIVLLANGLNKALAIKETVSGKITTEVPVSLLQLHPNLLIIVDKGAASLI
ncbi:MAG TPA: glucosamine-6-phosphate deaminase [Clostridia bacterium]|nr:glucosamine-6-phosphate deaminase [Clostridia bacterium]